MMKRKQCTKCGAAKPVSEFHKNRTCKGGLHYQCKTCRKEYRHVQRLKKNPQIKQRLSHIESHRIANGNSEKFCTKCLTWKSIDKFYGDKRAKDGLQHSCGDCFRKYQQIHKIEIAERQKKYRQTLNGHLRGIYLSFSYRCNNSKNKEYKNYGGRGIKCLFKSLNEFHHHIAVDLNLTYDDIKGLQIDRIDNDKHYEPGNIRFVTAKINANNKRNSKHAA